jgi:hypothetical protein
MPERRSRLPGTLGSGVDGPLRPGRIHEKHI